MTLEQALATELKRQAEESGEWAQYPGYGRDENMIRLDGNFDLPSLAEAVAEWLVTVITQRDPIEAKQILRRIASSAPHTV